MSFGYFPIVQCNKLRMKLLMHEKFQFISESHNTISISNIVLRKTASQVISECV